jgi:hypothetical protein
LHDDESGKIINKTAAKATDEQVFVYFASSHLIINAQQFTDIKRDVLLDELKPNKPHKLTDFV